VGRQQSRSKRQRWHKPGSQGHAAKPSRQVLGAPILICLSNFLYVSQTVPQDLLLPDRLPLKQSPLKGPPLQQAPLPCLLTLPVTIPGEKPANLVYSSKIQAISRAPVFMSGAGMSANTHKTTVEQLNDVHGTD
jgi:hypothetical protein